MAASDIPDRTLVFAFDGECWLFPFYCGVAKYLEEVLDTSHPNIKFLGVDTNGIIASALAFKLHIVHIYEGCKEMITTMHGNSHLFQYITNILTLIRGSIYHIIHSCFQPARTYIDHRASPTLHQSQLIIISSQNASRPECVRVCHIESFERFIQHLHKISCAYFIKLLAVAFSGLKTNSVKVREMIRKKDRGWTICWIRETDKVCPSLLRESDWKITPGIIVSDAFLSNVCDRQRLQGHLFTLGYLHAQIFVHQLHSQEAFRCFLRKDVHIVNDLMLQYIYRAIHKIHVELSTSHSHKRVWKVSDSFFL